MNNMRAWLEYRQRSRPVWAALAALILIALWFMFSIRVAGAEVDTLKTVKISTPSELNKEAVFWYRAPLGGAPVGLLMLVPGCNGDGRGMLNESGPWARFADEAHLVLVGPTFKTTLEEVHSRQGYYYPELWSGAATLKALEQIRAQTGVRSNKVLIFGFSAGSHFAHRFALWKPEKVAAFVAYSAGWWDEPKASLRDTPGLIMCGEADERFDSSFAFFVQGRRLGLPLIWRGYTGMGHELKPQVLKMAQTFLGYYAQQQKLEQVARRRQPSGTPFIGDIQSYRFYPESSPEAAHIPLESRVGLPSLELAKVWAQENPNVPVSASNTENQLGEHEP